MRVLGGLVLISLLWATPLCVGQTSDRDTSNIGIDREIREIINPLVRSNNYSGSVLIQMGGKKIFKESYGLANRENSIKTNSQTRFFLASVSAMFTAAATMKLIDAGKIALDDKLSKFFFLSLKMPTK